MSSSALLLDLDGTLIDTAPDFVRVLQAMLVRHGKPDPGAAAIRETVSDGARALVQLGFGLTPEADGFEALRSELLADYAQGLAEHSGLFPGIDEVLQYLESRQSAWGIVTNKPSQYAQPLLQALKLDQRCGVLVCPDHVTRTKPHPEPLLLAASRIGMTPEHCLYAGDHRRDIEAGAAAGMRTVACRWGYWHSNDPPEHWNADHTVEHPSDLLALLTD